MYASYDSVGVSYTQLLLSLRGQRYIRANSNVNNTAFWVLVHILVDGQLRKAVKQEVNAAWESEHLDVQLLCANATVLDRTFHECLRLKAGVMMRRKCVGRGPSAFFRGTIRQE